MVAAIAALIVWLGTFGPGGAPAQAALLNLTTQPPDIMSSFVNVIYSASTRRFEASGYALTFDPYGLPESVRVISGGIFSIDLYLTSAGIPTSGALSIGGTVAALGATTGTLLAGSILQFGFQDPPGDEIFEFLFNVTGGDLARYCGGQAVVILDAVDSGFRGTFGADFANTGLGDSDTSSSPVPEPSSGMVMLSLLGCGLATRGLRRRRSR